MNKFFSKLVSVITAACQMEQTVEKQQMQLQIYKDF